MTPRGNPASFAEPVEDDGRTNARRGEIVDRWIGVTAAALLGAFSLAAVPARSADTLAFILSPADQARLGLQEQALSLERRASQVDAFAKVLDPGPLAQLQSDLLSAEASTRPPKVEARRAPRALRASGGSIADKDVEAAVRPRRATTTLPSWQLLRRRLGLGDGDRGSPAELIARPAQGVLIQDLSSGQAALVHVDTPSNEGQAGARTVDVDVGSDSIHGVVLGPARTAEPRLQSSGLIVEVTGKSAILLSVGLTQSAHINSASSTPGVIIPRSAVIRFEGSDWAYVRTAPDRFERRLMQDPAPVDKGLFVASGFGPSEAVVVRGAAELFAVERARSTRSPDMPRHPPC